MFLFGVYCCCHLMKHPQWVVTEHAVQSYHRQAFYRMLRLRSNVVSSASAKTAFPSLAGGSEGGGPLFGGVLAYWRRHQDHLGPGPIGPWPTWGESKMMNKLGEILKRGGRKMDEKCSSQNELAYSGKCEYIL